MTVMEYIAEFDRLTLLCELEEKEHMKIAHFLKGLHNSIGRDLDLASYTTLEEDCKLALKVEKRRPATRFSSNTSFKQRTSKMLPPRVKTNTAFYQSYTAEDLFFLKHLSKLN